MHGNVAVSRDRYLQALNNAIQFSTKGKHHVSEIIIVKFLHVTNLLELINVKLLI